MNETSETKKRKKSKIAIYAAFLLLPQESYKPEKGKPPNYVYTERKPNKLLKQIEKTKALRNFQNKNRLSMI